MSSLVLATNLRKNTRRVNPRQQPLPSPPSLFFSPFLKLTGHRLCHLVFLSLDTLSLHVSLPEHEIPSNRRKKFTRCVKVS